MTWPLDCNKIRSPGNKSQLKEIIVANCWRRNYHSSEGFRPKMYIFSTNHWRSSTTIYRSMVECWFQNFSIHSIIDATRIKSLYCGVLVYVAEFYLIFCNTIKLTLSLMFSSVHVTLLTLFLSYWRVCIGSI